MQHPLFRLLAVVLAILLASSTLPALPKFAARTGERCQSCHIDPDGHAMRTLQGASYGRNELPVADWKKALALDTMSTALSPSIGFGTDVRTLFFYEAYNKTSSLFQMEGNLYLDLRLNKQFRIEVSKGLYQGFEIFGIARVLPLDGYIKAGKFTPSYGIHIDDHNAFIRGGRFSGAFAQSIPNGYPQGLRFGERSEDTGIELGIAPSIFSLTAGLFDGTPGGGLTGVAGSKNYAVALRGDAAIPTDAVNLTVGGSFYNYPNTLDPGHTQFYGAFGTLGLAENLVLISEVDWAISNVRGSEATGRMFYNELDYDIMSGLDILVGYEFYDPDIHVANGTVSTVNIGASFYPMSGVELRPLYRINRETPVEVSNDEVLFMLHYYL